MADRELAAKLQKRLETIGDDDGRKGNFVDFGFVPQPPAPPPPPPPLEPHVSINDIRRSTASGDGDELADMDQLIAQLQNISATTTQPLSRRFCMDSNNALPKLSENASNKVLHANNTTHSIISDLPPAVLLQSSRCTAPVLSIIHHKEVVPHKNDAKNEYHDHFDEQGKSELELKLLKQRQVKQQNSNAPIIQLNSTKPDSVQLSANNNPTSAAAIKFNSSNSNSIQLFSPIPSTQQQSSAIVAEKLPSIVASSSPERKTYKMSETSSSNSPSCSTSLPALGTNTNDELSQKLARRNMIAEGQAVEPAKAPKLGVFSEFHEFSRKQIKYFIETFKKFDEDRDNFIDFNELKRMMEKLGEAQTHIALKEMLKLVDEDGDNKICLREFMLIFRYAAVGQLECSNVFNELAAVDVTKEGVHRAADFFQAKIEEQTKLSKFEEEIRAEQNERKEQEAIKKERKQQFLANKAVFI